MAQSRRERGWHRVGLSGGWLAFVTVGAFLSCVAAYFAVRTAGEAGPASQLWTEVVVPEGAFVVVSGFAREGAEHEATGYRAASRPMVIGAGEDNPLVVSVGGELRSLRQSEVRALIGLVCGVALLGMAGFALHVEASLG